MKPIPHPKPFQSALWEHLDLIRKRRLARKSWPEIAEELGTLGVRIDRSTLRWFFNRARARGDLPFGREKAPGRREMKESISDSQTSADKRTFLNPSITKVTKADLLKPAATSSGAGGIWKVVRHHPE